MQQCNRSRRGATETRKRTIAGNERYGGRGEGGWVGGLDASLLPLIGVSSPNTVKKQSSANVWYFLQYG